MKAFLLILMSLNAHARFEIPGFELVYTAPVETSLAAPDLRGPVDVWVEMIDGAKTTLDFGQMYAVGKAGEPLDRVLAALKHAGERGVKIRFMLEKKMLRASDDATMTQLRAIKNLELRIYEFAQLGTDGIVHAKYFVVDGGREAYVGSQNFDWRSLKHIQETGIRSTDTAINKQALEIFNQDWAFSGRLAAGEKIPAPGATPESPAAGARTAYLVASPPSILPKGVMASETEITRLLGNATKEIRVQVLDYSTAHRNKTPYLTIDKALRAAAARGVKVKLLVSHWGTEKPGIDALKSLTAVANVEVRIATIPRAKEGKIPFARVNHSKIMAIDDRVAWVGTSNWSGGYLDQVRNLEVVIKNEKFAKRLAALHEQLWSSAYSVPVDVAREYPKPDKGND